MDIRNRRALKEEARRSLAGASYDPRKLALIHTAVSVGVALLVTLLDYYLNHQIEGTASGLSGMGSRRILATVQTTLQFVQTLALPFWEIGFVYVALRLLRQQPVGFQNLPEGFRRFGPVLRLRLMQAFLYFGAAIASIYIASFLFMLTPFAQPMMTLLEPVMDVAITVEQAQQMVQQFPVEELMGVMVPFFVIFAAIYLVLALMLHYRFRVADFIVMDQPGAGALRAMFGSMRMTRKKRWQLLKLDVSFWWYYLLLGLTGVIGYLDLILPQFGVGLPISSDAAWFVCYILGLLAQLVLFWYAKSFVLTTWAAAYEVLQQAEETPVPVQPQPKERLPWDEYDA